MNAAPERCFGPSVFFFFSFLFLKIFVPFSILGGVWDRKKGAVLDGVGHLFVTLSESAAER